VHNTQTVSSNITQLQPVATAATHKLSHQLSVHESSQRHGRIDPVGIVTCQITSRSDSLHSVPVVVYTVSLTDMAGYGHDLTEVNTGKYYTVLSECEGIVSIM
jgi:hypothetical protein